MLKAYCEPVCKRPQPVIIDYGNCIETGKPYTDIVCYGCQTVIVTFDGHVEIKEDWDGSDN